MRALSASKSGSRRLTGDAHRVWWAKAKVPQGDRRQVGDRRLGPERRRVEAGRDQRNRRVAGDERAVAPAAEMVPAAPVDELPALGRRDQHVSGGRGGERPPGALERVRIPVEIEHCGVPLQPPAVGLGGEAELLAVAACDGGTALAEEDDVRRGLLVEALREGAG